MRTFKITRTIAAAAIAAATFSGGYVTASQLHGHAASPQPCQTPAGTWLPSGDAGDFQGQGGVQTFVCTDGTWVHVSQYGNVRG
jgi:hypothetical protein